VPWGAGRGKGGCGGGQQVRLERELEQLRALVMDFSMRPAAMVERVRRLEHVTEVLHANR